MHQAVVIIGGGTAGLMTAEVISAHGVKVDVYDSMPSLGRKFLMAGKSGLNITHSEPFKQFVLRYGSRSEQIKPWLEAFGPEEIRQWMQGLGIESFVGTSGKVFPVGMKASPLLRAWLKRLDDAGVTFHLKHKWLGWHEDKSLRFDSPEGIKNIHADAFVLALGGGSWSRLGSDGAWVAWLKQAGITVEALRPSNCGFDVEWSRHFREKFQGYPIKSVMLSVDALQQPGEFVVTKEGVEGNLIYAVSAILRDKIAEAGKAIITLDLSPNRSYEWLRERLSMPRGSRSLASHLEKAVRIKGVKAGLLREFVPRDDLTNADQLAYSIKHLQIPLVAPRPLDEAISSAGGVMFEALDDNLMLKDMPGIFCAGEMLDWEAPTGGYLLTACFSSGYAAGQGVLKWLEN